MPAPSGDLADGAVVLHPRSGGPGEHVYGVRHRGAEVGEVRLLEEPDGRGRLTWASTGTTSATGEGEWADRAVRLLVEHAFTGVHLERVETHLDPGDERHVRSLTVSRSSTV